MRMTAPLHDPLAVAVIFGFSSGIYRDDNERYAIHVVTDGEHSSEDEVRGQVGRTIVSKTRDSVHGVKIPRQLDVDVFWAMLEECCTIAEENGAKP